MTEQLQELDLTELSDTDRALFDKYTKGMVRVSSKEFYSTVGQKNVHHLDSLKRTSEKKKPLKSASKKNSKKIKAAK